YCRHGPQPAQVRSLMIARLTASTKSGSGGCGDEEEGADHQDDEDGDGDA
nr:hypothetical protein [Tanacetum cinerariifolium]